MALISSRLGLLFIMTPHTGCTAIGRYLEAEYDAVLVPPEDVRNPDGTLRIPSKHTQLGQLLEAGLITPEQRRSLVVAAGVRNPFDMLASAYLGAGLPGNRPLRGSRVGSRESDVWLRGVGSSRYRALRRRLRRAARWRAAPAAIPAGAPAQGGSSAAPAGTATAASSESGPDAIDRNRFEAWLRARFGRSVLARMRGKPWHRPIDFAEGADVVLRFERLQADFEVLLAQLGVTDSAVIPQVNPTRSRRSAAYQEFYTDASVRLVEEIFADYLRRYGYAFEALPVPEDAVAAVDRAGGVG